MLNKKFTCSLVVLSCLMLCTVMAEAAIVGQWNMDEGAGTIAADSTTNGNDFTDIGTGNGSEFSWISPGYGGSGSAVSAPNNNDSWLQQNTLTDPISYQMRVEAMIRPTGLDADGSYIVGLYNGFGLHFTGPTEDMMRMVPCVGWTWAPIATATGVQAALFDGDWHKVAGVFNGIPDANGMVYSALEWDGVEVGRTYMDTGGTPLHIGHLNATGPNFFIGANWVAASGGTQNYFGDIDMVTLSNVPEPATVSLLVLGGLALLRRRKA